MVILHSFWYVYQRVIQFTKSSNGLRPRRTSSQFGSSWRSLHRSENALALERKHRAQRPAAGRHSWYAVICTIKHQNPHDIPTISPRCPMCFLNHRMQRSSKTFKDSDFLTFHVPLLDLMWCWMLQGASVWSLAYLESKPFDDKLSCKLVGGFHKWW